MTTTAEAGRRGGKVKSEAKTATAQANGAKGGRPCANITVDPAGNWRLYWPGPLPAGATAHGVVTRNKTREAGALLRTGAGVWVQGNNGVMRSLDQRAVARQLE